VPAWTAESDQAGAWFGRWATTAGDVNGDGYSDVIVGAPYYDNGQADEGRAFVYHGSAAGLEAEPAWTTESNQVSADLGWSVGTAGDVNGDGYSDVIVGANTYDNGQQNEGRAFVYHGSAAGLASGAAWMAESDQANGAFGVSVATAGDVNGDGYSDVIVGAHGYDDDQENEGRAYVFHGSAAGLTPDPTWTVEGDQATAYLGVSVATAGDVNGDGYGDVVVGAYCYDNGETDEGRALVYYGSAAGLAANPSWTAENDDTYAGFGGSVAAAGDVNGDGYGDVIVGSPYYDNGQIGEGRAYVFHGSAAGLHTTPAWTAEGDQVFASFSSSAGTTGDVNGDTDDDVIVGAWVYDNGQENEGGAFVYHGSSDRLSPMANAGPDQDVGRLAPVTLDGSTSFDPDGDYPLTYGWHQAGGAPVAFTHHLSVTTFTAPGDLAVLTFTLTVTDSLGLPSTTPDEVVITVRGDLTFLPLVVRH